MALVPKDVRADRDFQIVKGVAEMLRTSLPMDDPANDSFTQGEVVVRQCHGHCGQGYGRAAGTPLLNARICWTTYVPDDTNNGQTDALGTKTVDVLSGPFQFKTTSAFFVPCREHRPSANSSVVILDGGVGKLYNEPYGTAARTSTRFPASLLAKSHQLGWHHPLGESSL